MNVEVREFKIIIKNTSYTFRLDFEALKKFDKRFGLEGIEVFNKFLSGVDTYDCIVKILSCSCVEKDWTEVELSKSIPFNFKVMKLFDEITFALAEGLLPDPQEEEPKNEETSHSQDT